MNNKTIIESEIEQKRNNTNPNELQCNNIQIRLYQQWFVTFRICCGIEIDFVFELMVLHFSAQQGHAYARAYNKYGKMEDQVRCMIIFK